MTQMLDVGVSTQEGHQPSPALPSPLLHCTTHATAGMTLQCKACPLEITEMAERDEPGFLYPASSQGSCVWVRAAASMPV